MVRGDNLDPTNGTRSEKVWKPLLQTKQSLIYIKLRSSLRLIQTTRHSVDAYSLDFLCFSLVLSKMCKHMLSELLFLVSRWQI